MKKRYIIFLITTDDFAALLGQTEVTKKELDWHS